MLKVTADQWIGAGSFADVYRISQRRVVKVFSIRFSDEVRDALIVDEVQGGYTLQFGLPVLKIVDVITMNGKKTKGLIKRYIPLEVTYDEVCDLHDDQDLKMDWDAGNENFRKDTRGNFFQVDTQTADCYGCYSNGTDEEY